MELGDHVPALPDDISYEVIAIGVAIFPDSFFQKMAYWANLAIG
jgi:hypothetical protein